MKSFVYTIAVLLGALTVAHADDVVPSTETPAAEAPAAVVDEVVVNSDSAQPTEAVVVEGQGN